MTRSRTSALLALLLAAPAAGQTPSVPPPTFAAAILERNEPAAARRFLYDELWQNAARSAGIFDEVFARATEVKDIADLVEGPMNLEPATLRRALFARPGCLFCQKPAEMELWIGRYVDPKLAPADRLGQTFWDWKSLNPAQTAFLAAHGAPEASWTRLDLLQRRGKLLEWANVERAAVMALNPRNPAEADAMQNRVFALYQVLPSDQGNVLWQRYEQARAGVDGLAQARERFGKTSDPRLKGLLQQAQDAGDPEARLAALSQLYDNGGEHNAVLATLAPPRPGQAFDDSSRQAVAALLSSGLLRETDGTWAGQELRDFYAHHPLAVELQRTDNPWLAWYQNDKMTFNERYVEEYVKARGRTLADLTRDPSLLEPLLQEIAPIFVHEATHHRQDAWAHQQGIPFWGGEAAEEEAMMTESLFVLQKLKNDPAYKRFVQDHQTTSTNVREALALSRRLQKDRADWFGSTTMATHYPEYLSMAGTAWCQILWHNQLAAPIQTEIERRRTLPADQQTALEHGSDLAGNYADYRSFESAMRTAGTASLQAFLAQQKAEIANEPRIYAQYVARLDDVKRRTDERLGLLENAPAPPGRGLDSAAPPPPPSVGRR